MQSESTPQLDDEEAKWWCSVGPPLSECEPYFDVERTIFMRLVDEPLPDDALGRVIASVVNMTQWYYQDALRCAATALGCELANERGWQSESDGANPYPSTNEAIRALQEPTTYAEAIARFHRQMDLVPHSYIIRAVLPDFDFAG